MKIQVISTEELAERNTRFHNVSPRVSRADFEHAELTARGTALFCWHNDGFSWLCPGCARWHYGKTGEVPVSGWEEPRWVNSGTIEAPTLTPSLGCPGWKHGTCPSGHWWLRNGELVQAL